MGTIRVLRLQFGIVQTSIFVDSEHRQNYLDPTPWPCSHFPYFA